MLITFSHSGLFVYTTLNGMIWAVMFLSRGTYEPKDYHRREYWTWKPAGEKPWIFRMFTKGRFWEDERLQRKKHHLQRRLSISEADEIKEACDTFALSEIDLDSMRTSRVATSFAASSTHTDQRDPAVASEGNAGSCVGPHGMDIKRGAEMHELEVVVLPQHAHVVEPGGVQVGESHRLGQTLGGP